MPNVAQHSPKMAEQSAKIAPRWRNIAPRWCQDGFKMTLRQLKIPPRCAQEDPMWVCDIQMRNQTFDSGSHFGSNIQPVIKSFDSRSHDAPRWLQHEAQDEPKMRQDSYKKPQQLQVLTNPRKINEFECFFNVFGSPPGARNLSR